MRKLILAASTALTLAALSGAAQAQSLGFDGFYAGIAAGGVASTIELDNTVPGFGRNSTDIGLKGVTGGAFLGYGFKMTNVYIGIEGEYDVSNAEHRTTSFGFNVDVNREQALGGAARLGYFFGRDTMLYGKVGYSYAQFEVESLGFRERKWNGGLKVGGGMEHAITPNVLARIGYDVDFTEVKLPAAGFKGDTITQVGKLGIAYKF